jgi:hypothetical protein
MKKVQIRKGVFETNSSSTHSITIVSKEEFEKFKAGSLMFHQWEGKLVEPDKDNVSLVSYGRYGEYYETFEKSYKTSSGDEIVAFGYYGHD